MQLDAIEHFAEIVLPALGDYNEAENSLTRAITENHEEITKAKAQYAALRFGGSAAIYLHHFSDVVANRPPDGFPDFRNSARNVREWLALREKTARDDLVLLEDVADALKHSVLTHRLPREVEHAGQVLGIDRAYGEADWGTGKWGGVDEVWIIAKSGRRPLTGVLTSVANLWNAEIRRLTG